MGDEFVNQIWTPDTFVINAVETQVHKLMKENQKIFMNLTNGFTMHTSRYVKNLFLNIFRKIFPID